MTGQRGSSDPTSIPAPAPAPQPEPPQFDMVLRGYDRIEVDEYIASLLEENAALRRELDVRAPRPRPQPSAPSRPRSPGAARTTSTPLPKTASASVPRSSCGWPSASPRDAHPRDARRRGRRGRGPAPLRGAAARGREGGRRDPLDRRRRRPPGSRSRPRRRRRGSAHLHRATKGEIRRLAQLLNAELERPDPRGPARRPPSRADRAGATDRAAEPGDSGIELTDVPLPVRPPVAGAGRGRRGGRAPRRRDAERPVRRHGRRGPSRRRHLRRARRRPGRRSPCPRPTGSPCGSSPSCRRSCPPAGVPVVDAARYAALALGFLSVVLLWPVLRALGAGPVPAAVAAGLIGVLPPVVTLHAGITCGRPRHDVARRRGGAGRAWPGAAARRPPSWRRAGRPHRAPGRRRLLALAAHLLHDRVLGGRLPPAARLPITVATGATAVAVAAAAAGNGPLAGVGGPVVGMGTTRHRRRRRDRARLAGLDAAPRAAARADARPSCCSPSPWCPALPARPRCCWCCRSWPWSSRCSAEPVVAARAGAPAAGRGRPPADRPRAGAPSSGCSPSSTPRRPRRPSLAAWVSSELEPGRGDPRGPAGPRRAARRAASPPNACATWASRPGPAIC